jgi:hypothetical protein
MQFFEERGRGGYGRIEVPSLPAGVKGYTINMRPYESAGLMHGNWTHFTGFSEHVLKYIAGEEKAA